MHFRDVLDMHKRNYARRDALKLYCGDHDLNLDPTLTDDTRPTIVYGRSMSALMATHDVFSDEWQERCTDAIIVDLTLGEVKDAIESRAVASWAETMAEETRKNPAWRTEHAK